MQIQMLILSDRHKVISLQIFRRISPKQIYLDSKLLKVRQTCCRKILFSGYNLKINYKQELLDNLRLHLLVAKASLQLNSTNLL